VTGIGENGIDIGLECKRAADDLCQQEVGREWSGSHWYKHEKGALVVATTRHYGYQSAGGRPRPH